jgi:hypothetical protein
MPTAGEVRQAIAEQVQAMLHPPIRNVGVAGIRKAAQMVPQWPALMDENALRGALFSAFVFIDATGGTGGGLFRTMFGRFLLEAAAITGEKNLLDSAAEFVRLGDRWQVLAEMLKAAAAASDPSACLGPVSPLLDELHGLEHSAWQRLGKMV